MGKTITRANLNEAAASRTGLSKADIASISDRMFELMGDALMARENVKLTGFGSLQVRARAERVGRNPRTGTEHTISQRDTVVFTPGAQLRDLCQTIAPAAESPKIQDSRLRQSA